MTRSSDYMRALGSRALGGRLRRLSERIDRDAARLYAEAGVVFEQRWLGVLDLLIVEGPLSVGEIARRLGISHVSVSQTRQSLERAGLIDQQPDPADGRRRMLALTDKGRALADRLKPLWMALDAVAADLDAAGGGVMAVLDRLDGAMDEASLYDRVKQKS